MLVQTTPGALGSPKRGSRALAMEQTRPTAKGHRSTSKSRTYMGTAARRERTTEHDAKTPSRGMWYRRDEQQRPVTAGRKRGHDCRAKAMTAEPRQTQGAAPLLPSPQLIPRTHTQTLPAAVLESRGEKRHLRSSR